MFKTILKAGVVATVILSAMLNGTAEAKINTSKKPLQTYSFQKVYCGDYAGNINYKYWVDANIDLMKINKYSDNWAEVTYPNSKGQPVTHWIDMSKVFYNPNYSNWNGTSNRSQSVYRSYSGTSTIGSVSSGEPLEVVSEYNGRYQVIYILSNGTGYKMGWVPTEYVTKSTTPVKPTLQNGYYKIYSANVNRCLLAPSTALRNGTNICLYDDIGVCAEIFYLQNQNDGYFTLKTSYTDLYMDAANGSSNNGTNVQLYENNGSNAQRWRLIDAGNGQYYIESKLRVNLSLDCQNGGRSNGTNVQLWNRGNVAWNKWRFVKVNTPVGDIKGDANSDWKVDKYDYDLLKKFINKEIPRGINILNSDMNNDGRVDKTDLTLLGNKLGIKDEPASKYAYPLGKKVTFVDNTGEGYKHDYITTSGTPIYAICDGTLTFKQRYCTQAKTVGKKYFEKYSTISYGNFAELSSSDGLLVRYCHLSRFWNPVTNKEVEKYSYVKSANAYPQGTVSNFNGIYATPTIATVYNVKKGQLIGYTGNTGNSSGPHLHFEVWKNGTRQQLSTFGF